MTVYLLVKTYDITLNGYFVATETCILDVFDSRQKAIKAMYEDDDDDPNVDFHIVKREVL